MPAFAHTAAAFAAFLEVFVALWNGATAGG